MNLVYSSNTDSANTSQSGEDRLGQAVSFERSLQEYIKSGEYFVEARNWYNSKYLHIVTHRSVLFIIFCLAVISYSTIFISGNSLFPIKQQVRYFIKTPGTYQAAVKITEAQEIPNDPLGSIAGIMVKNYVVSRESYDYSALKQQFTYIKNNSTRIVFRKFFNFMNIDNPDSPILKYQKFIRRSVKIISITYPSPGEAVVVFESMAKLASSEILENKVWESTINYEMDKINLNLPSGTEFNFAVTNYKTVLKQDKLSK